ALAAVIVRMAITFRDNMRILSTARHQAEVDELTGLGNRRRLITDLQQTCLTATPERPFVLIIYDLDGFKNYNDLFGHPAGDSLLTRLAGSLASSLEGLGRAYRMGGDEFCVLAPMPGENARELALSAAAALSERGELFEIGCSYGASVIPFETIDPSQALRLADRRLYAAKHARNPSASHQSKDVLLRALHERDRELGAHLGD